MTVKYSAEKNLMKIKVTDDNKTVQTSFTSNSQTDQIKLVLKTLTQRLANVKEKTKVNSKINKKKKKGKRN